MGGRLLKNHRLILGLLLVIGAVLLTMQYIGLTHPNRRKPVPAVNDKDQVVRVAFVVKYAFRKMKILRNMARCLRSLLLRASSPEIHFHILLDNASKKRVVRTLDKVAADANRTFKVTFYDVGAICYRFQGFIQIMRRYFFTKDVGRYDDDIFFISELFHMILPQDVPRVIMIDLDIQFRGDIRRLQDHFDRFSPSNLIGIGPDLQPQYRSDFGEYRRLHPKTVVGSPRKQGGQQGFNTGVVLFDLQRMRNSSLYGSLLNERAIALLCQKYFFRGYLGHQDFFTLTGMEHPEMYYQLDCVWNRQLDTGWKNNVPEDVFKQYHRCEGEIQIDHGNGDAIMKEPDWHHISITPLT